MMSGYFTPVANHLWQSTLFVAAVRLGTLALRRNRAPVRYGLWLAASLKFLIPFSLLVTAGSWMHWPAPAAATAAVRPISRMAEDIGQLFPARKPAAPEREVVRERGGALSPVLPVVWLCGFLASGMAWFRRWRVVRAAVRESRPIATGLPIEVRVSRGRMEPGVVGILRPVLLLPDGITERLTPAQFRAVLDHEMCHVRRRDNLAAAAQMAVETVFWFYPVVHWVGRRMLEERERACDEAVVQSGNDAAEYAEGILNVCRFYLEAPAACVSGVTGAELKERIEGIMAQRITCDLNLGKRLLLYAAAAVAVAGPVAIGVMHAQAAPEVKFEVASVKANKSADMRTMNLQTLPGGRLSMTNVPLYFLITEAYGVSFQSLRMSGGPEWTRSERFDIEARAEAGTIPVNLSDKERERRMRPMMQALLADRFKLVVRRETKELPVYAVTVAKGGPKMEKVDEKDCGPGTPCHAFMGGQGRGVHGKADTIEDLAAFVENWADRPIVDRTELPGLFKMDTDGWVPMRGPGGGNEGMDDPARPTLFTVFEKQLGLKLESQKAPIEVFVIEKVERPVGN